MERFQRILLLSDECARLCLELQACFRRERTALIEFKMDDLIQNNFEKERVLGLLTTTKQILRETMAEETDGKYDPERFQKNLGPKDLAVWAEHSRRWLTIWEELRSLCVKNQDFYKHSLRNLDSIVDNLKRLFGLHSTYTAKGTRHDLSPRGSVVEGSF
jgi:hypothetical protein